MHELGCVCVYMCVCPGICALFMSCSLPLCWLRSHQSGARRRERTGKKVSLTLLHCCRSGQAAVEMSVERAGVVEGGQRPGDGTKDVPSALLPVCAYV